MRVEAGAEAGHSAPMTLPLVRTAGLLAAIAGGLALGGALASQHWGGLVPCALCLVERWPWRAVIVLGLLAAALPPRAGRIALALCLLALLASAAAAATHVGVEAGWWRSPLPECAAPHIGGSSIAQRLADMPLRPSKPCDAPSYIVPGVPVSMAAMNLIWSLAVTLALAIYLAISREQRR
jgi:disulfide bond formation protein DsbB